MKWRPLSCSSPARIQAICRVRCCIRTGERSSMAEAPPPATDESPGAAAAERYATFDEFWPYYLRAHSKRSTRAYHYVGTSLVVGLAAAAAAKRKPWLLAAGPAGGDGFAWAGTPARKT